MRLLLLVPLLLPVAASAQTANAPVPMREVMPPLTSVAPVPNIGPGPGVISRYGGTPNSMPFVLSPPGIGYSVAGPVNATPYSTSPSASWQPDAALPDGRDSVLGGAGGSMVPNLSQ